MQSSPPPGFRTGLIALVGRTNVGKSTLMNSLLRSRVSIVSPKPQTTRHAIQGILHRPDAQLVFVDTPGFFQTHRNALVDRLHERARAALEGIDVVLHVVDPSRPVGVEDNMVLDVVAALTIPKVLCLNKADLPHRPFRAPWLERRAAYTALVDVAGITGRGLDTLIETLLPLLPVGEPLYGPGEITNASRDFRIGEVVREKIYLLTEEEVPYRTAVRVTLVEERTLPKGDVILHVEAQVLVAEERYKGMLIGEGGRMIRDLGTAARADLQDILGRRVHLALSVKVDRSLPQ